MEIYVVISLQNEANWHFRFRIAKSTKLVDVIAAYARRFVGAKEKMQSGELKPESHFECTFEGERLDPLKNFFEIEEALEDGIEDENNRGFQIDIKYTGPLDISFRDEKNNVWFTKPEEGKLKFINFPQLLEDDDPFKRLNKAQRMAVPIQLRKAIALL